MEESAQLFDEIGLAGRRDKARELIEEWKQ
jgi:hypothetical protein